MQVVLISVLAGVLGTGIGGLLTALLGYRTDKMVGGLLSFAGGVMISIVFIEIIPESIELTNVWMAVSGLVAGVFLALFLDFCLEKVTLFGSHHGGSGSGDGSGGGSGDGSSVGSGDGSGVGSGGGVGHGGGGGEHGIFHMDEDTSDHQHNIAATYKHPMLRSGFLMLLVIGMHNLPEGMALGVSVNQSINLVITLAFVIGVHNIPLGMAIAAPFISGGLRRWRAAILTMVAGTPTVIGAIAGVFFVSISDLSLSITLSIAGGAMLYAVFCEFLPQSSAITKGRIPALIQLLGILCGTLFLGVLSH